ncbi:MAG TPA: peptidoglycan bridge formation glycyltransferase FemA/FemB family protein [Bellilinea sp.]|nr:peptidoglycan bridge formation glycyltransferase FemA/FemB family protein [Bellilinea sp.]
MKALEWDAFHEQLPMPHLLQSSAWAELKSKYGWTWQGVSLTENSGALILAREQKLTPLGPSAKVLYSPRGPLCGWSSRGEIENVLALSEKQAKDQRAIFLKIDPEVIINRDEIIDHFPITSAQIQGSEVETILRTRGWVPAQDQVQFRNTMWLRLSDSEDVILEKMKQKTRYNIRLAQKKGVTVRVGGIPDLGLLYKMYAETSTRDGFVIRNEKYYQDAWSIFIHKGMATPLIADVDSEPVAGLMLYTIRDRAYYLYGMSTNKHREKMPNYLLQWEAIRLAKSKGCHLYDLWGAPDEADAQESMFGVYRFKEGLGSHLVRFIGAWDYPLNRTAYSLYSKVLPKVLNIMRRNRIRQTRNEVGL